MILIMYKVNLIKHKNLKQEDLLKICAIKSLNWPYPITEQLSWIKNNIEENDYHLMIKQNEEVIAYANLVNVTATTINGCDIVFKGVGNVCTSEKGKGYGNIIMTGVNNVLATKNWPGILLCKHNLLGYYEKFNWKTVETLCKKRGILTLTHNCNAPLGTLSNLSKIF